MARYQRKTDEKIGDILIRIEAITKEQLDRALDFQRQEGGLLGEILLKLGYMNEIDIVAALTEQFGIPFLPIENYDLKKELVDVLPENVAKQYNTVPVDVVGDMITLAMSDPFNQQAIEDIGMITGKKVQIFISTATAVAEAITKLYKKG